MNKFSGFAVLAIAASLASGAEAASIKLDSFTSDVQSVSIMASPISGTPGTVGASGFNMTDVNGSLGLGSFVAWCVDIAHYLMPVGQQQEYKITDTPFSNSEGLTEIGKSRVQAVFDANYGVIDLSNGDQAAAFQMALWDAAFETESGDWSVSSGVFQANSTGSTELANTFLANASNYSGGRKWKMTFLEIEGQDANRARNTGQNLVTVSAVPLPAAGVLLLAALGGLGLVARRRDV